MKAIFSAFTLTFTFGAAFLCAAASPGYFDIGTTITLETGDTWVQDHQKYRLYGVQSCLRGTFFTSKDNMKRDCGEASMAVLAAYVHDTKPVCAPVIKGEQLTYVMCYANVAGKALDLGTILISTGFAFAALNKQGIPYNPAYSVAEQQAREKKAGLWAFPDVQHPSFLISRAAHEKGAKN